ncbi:xylulokinase [Ponticoccus sp. SC2-23]|uniref:xylulokinase n=1 Tax=Alexandriicola marinus TaxID=2081710 RepID=UPI000FD74641|nr:xylulokinase [Alexandriicola marinus]MBM1220826.1 xylulokinase [Ponticoccus sp. SC6-9]MBM1225396.1 xylulokinase [Ponticoccus sp. SC6-15]MBM1227579.1 xylulokinase [Ponticoccus sp. SC6-38]MBM1234783.1 xylulokinase [Ponticoccus sp. SC6-45]MBM1238081.1 xylulokinase [Ponticoccus sp. SC6-49]MBM1244286.1 xylulokinase [Ponticoccus sp. SC2-64]MBM1248307.1 xylulokinase [Ponticoccus sp. SC6-42]MBM1252481.1 xylulokinase [Ponticoccus sp. SC6-33]MBM1256090.1 xylulokinase [Ponticoccus sp. SC6-60]MBM1
MFIGLDLGTSGLKAVVIDEAQNVLAEATASLTVSRPHDGWSEQDPAHWIAATRSVMAELGARVDLSAVRGIGLSGQMHGATALDAEGEVLRPCILWNDTRAYREAAELDADPRFRALTGNIVFPGFTAPKLVWMKNNEPALFARVAKVLLPKDYLRLFLTGEAVAEMSDAAGTSWLDVGRRDWSDDLLAATGLSRDAMPRLVEGSEVSATLRDDLARDWGLPAGVVVAGGGGDNAASAVGVGVVKPGEAFVSLGTSGVLFAASAAYQPDPASAVHTFCHALPGTWHQMGVILAATDALNWYAALTGEDAAVLTGDLGALQAPERTLFLPYLGGERTPHNDAQIRGAFLHLDHGSDRAALTRTVLEGVTHAFRDSFDALTGTGTQIERLIAVGGGSRSDYWLKAIATSLDMPVERPVAGDFGGAFGAARLGLMAATGAGAEIATPPRIEEVIEPDRTLTDAFAEAHSRYRASFAALRNLT